MTMSQNQQSGEIMIESICMGMPVNLLTSQVTELHHRVTCTQPSAHGTFGRFPPFIAYASVLLCVMTSLVLQYYGFYQVGTPGQYYKACFDTGSSATWLPGINCPFVACAVHEEYTPANSSTGRVSLSVSCIPESQILPHAINVPRIFVQKLCLVVILYGGKHGT